MLKDAHPDAAGGLSAFERLWRPAGLANAVPESLGPSPFRLPPHPMAIGAVGKPLRRHPEGMLGPPERYEAYPRFIGQAADFLRGLGLGFKLFPKEPLGVGQSVARAAVPAGL